MTRNGTRLCSQHAPYTALSRISETRSTRPAVFAPATFSTLWKHRFKKTSFSFRNQSKRFTKHRCFVQQAHKSWGGNIILVGQGFCCMFYKKVFWTQQNSGGGQKLWVNCPLCLQACVQKGTKPVHKLTPQRHNDGQNLGYDFRLKGTESGISFMMSAVFHPPSDLR